MKVQKQLGWYLAFLIVIAPILGIFAINPDWLGRLVGLSLFFVLPPVLCFWYALGTKRSIDDLKDPKKLWPSYLIKVFGDKLTWVTRILIFGGGCLIFFLFTLPFLKDLSFIAQNRIPLSIIEKVIETSRNSISGLTIEKLILEDSKLDQNKEFTAWYFTPGHISEGKKYEFLYLPNTHIILDAKLILE